MGRHAAKNVEKRLNELVALVHKEEPEWSINKIAQQIWVANEDLEGFTTKTIYNNLDESNRMLLDHSKQNRNRNKFPEESVVTLQHKVIEDSSSPLPQELYQLLIKSKMLILKNLRKIYQNHNKKLKICWSRKNL